MKHNNFLVLLLALGAVVALCSPATVAADDDATVISLFDGKALGQWKSTKFGGEGDVEVRDGEIRIGAGNPLSGINWSGKHPKMDYEIALEAMRVNGSDFFCALTFPVDESSCSFICGGWGGGVVGLSSLDGADASENETTDYKEFENGHWYKIRVRVTKGKIEAWIDDKQFVDVDTEGKRIGVRIEVDLSRPLGIATYDTTAALRDIKIRRVDTAAKK